MIDVVMGLNARGEIRGYRISGHAGYAEAGRDIVCSAVSALGITAALGITRVLSVKASVRQDDRRGELCLALPPGAPESASVILRTLAEGLKEIQKNYPECVRIAYSETEGIE